MIARTTPTKVIELAHGQVFVFGSNLLGIHGASAALTARRLFGAQLHVGEGPTGRCYALPTKRAPYAKMSLGIVEIGCGLAGFSIMQIAPLFRAASELPNVWLPASFWRILSE